MSMYVTSIRATSKQWRCCECNMWLNGVHHYRDWLKGKLVGYCELHFGAAILAGQASSIKACIQPNVWIKIMDLARKRQDG